MVLDGVRFLLGVLDLDGVLFVLGDLAVDGVLLAGVLVLDGVLLLGVLALDGVLLLLGVMASFGVLLAGVLALDGVLFLLRALALDGVLFVLGVLAADGLLFLLGGLAVDGVLFWLGVQAVDGVLFWMGVLAGDGVLVLGVLVMDGVLLWLGLLAVDGVLFWLGVLAVALELSREMALLYDAPFFAEGPASLADPFLMVTFCPLIPRFSGLPTLFLPAVSAGRKKRTPGSSLTGWTAVLLLLFPAAFSSVGVGWKTWDIPGPWCRPFLWRLLPRSRPCLVDRDALDLDAVFFLEAEDAEAEFPFSGEEKAARMV
jgi:hypothetical protein